MSLRKIHFIGIGGVGMAGLAALLKARGHDVSGCDLSASPRTKWLESLGIPVSVGHDPSHLSGIEEAIVTPAVPRANPEYLEARARAEADGLMKLRYRGEVLAEIVNASRGVAVCGTHGKTTTATFTAKLLKALGAQPSWCIGGETGTMPVAGSDGRGPLVVEADESDGTLALYKPEVLVLNACDFDHLEHFSSVEDYFNCYRTAIRNTKREVIVCADHPKALELTRETATVHVTSFGFSENAAVKASDWPNIPVPGRHNVMNALAAIAVAKSFGYSDEVIRAAIPGAVTELPDRRFELVSNERGVRIYTDYAHHPAELKCAVEMAAALEPKRLRVIFQPHRYTRTKALLDEFPPAFEAASEVVLVPVYAAFEDPVPGGDIADLYRAFRHRNRTRPVLLARNAEEAWKHMFLTLEPGDMVLIAGAGDIIRLMPRVRADMALPAPANRFWKDLSKHSFFKTGGKTCGGGKPAIIGMGSNTWISDCATDDEYVKSDLPIGATLIPDHPELAFMAGIPGTIGGWVKMNAGAHGDEIGNHVESVTLSDGRTLTHDECGFGYRTSRIEGLITGVKLASPGVARVPGAPADFIAKRRAFPPRCCGSVFKNPPNDFAGRLLDEVGAKSMNCGGASVWREHANVIVTEEGATSSDVLALARIMALAVRNRFGIILKPEIKGLET